MQTIARTTFTTVKTEGGLLPVDLLQRIADGDASLPGLRPEDYHLLPGERLNEAVNRAWNRCLGAWQGFADLRRTLPESDTGTTLTRERWLQVLFQELGYGRLPTARGGLTLDDGTNYPISHVWESTPIHLVTFRQDLDRRSDIATAVKRSPHSLMQEFLNRSDQHLWGIIANGLKLRLLRDNASLSRAADVEFDLEAMMEGELYAEFALLWLVCHQSRFEELGNREWGVGSGEGGVGSGDTSDTAPYSPLPTPYSLLEQAILSIKVLDCATGFGHMLIGAGRRLARHLARIRNGGEEPTPAELRSALRDVVRHCLYGVDVNDMAVELCKVALWMETLEPGKPLSFLDNHIQCGNSLIGVTPGLDIEEIPDDAFQPVTGDDKATATALRRRNKRERQGQLGFQFDVTVIESLEDLERWRAGQMAQIDAIDEEDVGQIVLKERAYGEYLASDRYERSRLEYDLWTAAFFWPIPAGDADAMLAPTQQALIELRAGHTLDAELVRRVRDLAEQHQFFHWELAFPEVFAGSREWGVGSSGSAPHSLFPTLDSPLPISSGVDVLLSNPPWERKKLQEKEWFAIRSPEIANAPNAAARRQLIADLAKDDPALYAAFESDKACAENESLFTRNSGHYPLCGRGDVNTYAVFAELTRQVIADSGRAGVIVPSGIATDDTTKYFFQEIMEIRSLASLYDFENRRAIFPDVHRSYKFCLLTLRGQSDQVGAPAEFVFFALGVADLRDDERLFTLTAQEIALLNPNTRTCPIFRSRRDAELTKGVYRRVPVLIKEGPPEENPWGVSFLRMLDMSNDSHLFRTREQLQAEGWRLIGNRFTREEVYLPLYEAKLLHHFDHRWATYDGLETHDLSEADKCNPDGIVLPRYWVQAAEVEARLKEYRPRWLVGFRDICRSTDERTAIFSVLPRVGVGNKVPLLVSEISKSVAALVCVNGAALSFDYAARQSIGGTTMNFYIMKQLPFLPPESYQNHCQWEPAFPPSTLCSWLLPRALELTYTAWDLEPFARDVVSAWKEGIENRELGVGAGETNPHSLLPTPPLPLGRGSPLPPALRAGRRLLPPLRHRPRRRGLHPGDLPHRQAQGHQGPRRIPHPARHPGDLRRDGRSHGRRSTLPHPPRPAAGRSARVPSFESIHPRTNSAIPERIAWEMIQTPEQLMAQYSRSS